MIIRKIRASDLDSAMNLYRFCIPIAFYAEAAEVNWDDEIDKELKVKLDLLHQAVYGDGQGVRCLVAAVPSEASLDLGIVGIIAHYPLGKEIRTALGSRGQGITPEAAWETTGELGALYVHPDYQGQGIASQLIRAMAITLEANGVEAFALDSGFSKAISKWLKKFGPAYHIAKDFWGPGKDHYLWHCKTQAFSNIALRPLEGHGAVWDAFTQVSEATALEDFAYTPANLHFDASCCYEKGSDSRIGYYDQFYQLTLDQEPVAILMLERGESSGYWDWALHGIGKPLAQAMLEWLLKRFPALDCTMAPLEDRELYEGIGWHLGDYGRYLGQLALKAYLPRSFAPRAGIRIVALEGHNIVGDSGGQGPRPLTEAQKVQVAQLIGMATSGTCTLDQYEGLLAMGSEVTLGRLTAWAAIDEKTQALVAYVAFWLDASGLRGVLETIACAPQWRGKGIGSALVARGLERLKTWGCEVVSVSTSEGNRVAQGLYQAMGFERIRWLATYKKPQQRPKAVIFDLYGTLVDIHTDEGDPRVWDNLAHYYNGILGALEPGWPPNNPGWHPNNPGWPPYSGPTIKDRYQALVSSAIEAARLRASQAHGRSIRHVDIDLLKVFEALFVEARSGLKADFLKAKGQEAATLFRALSRHRLGAYPYALDLLKWLGDQGYCRILLSNAQVCFTEMELAATGLNKAFDAIYLSGDYGLTKPEPAYFERMLKDQGLRPQDCLFVGNDHLADLEGANTVGIPCVYLHTACSQDQIPDWLPGHLLLMDGDLSRLLQYFKVAFPESLS